MTEEIVKSAAIEGERLDFEEVRSSVARRFGIPEKKASGDHIESLADMMMDARCNFEVALTPERLCG